MVGAEKAVGLSWVSVRRQLPFDGHECALICRNPNTNDLRKTIGCRLHGNWQIQDSTLQKYDVRAWLKLPSIASDIERVALWDDDAQERLVHSVQGSSTKDRSSDKL